MENFRKLKMVSLLLGAFICGACATLVACQAEDFVKIFAFDRQNQRLYFGPKENPTETMSLNDEKIDEMLCMSRADWTAVKNKLATCH